MSNATTWKEQLGDAIEPELSKEIDVFDTQMDLRKQGKIEEKLFAETRLRRGAYGQRYDNGRRHDGVESRELAYPRPELTKGPETLWDAPGMMRIKIPMGKMSAEQVEVHADLAEEYSDSILHVTTRQDIQLHFVHIEDTPDLMRRLAAVGVTTREACGNSIRNVTACPRAGVCSTQGFDVMPYANALTYFLLGHDDTQDFGRKVKIAFSGCHQYSCGLTNFHDMGLIAKTREVDGKIERGFQFVVGGGLGAVPAAAKVFDEFLPVEELLPMNQAICRVFARLGEKENRARARLKFLVKKLGIDEFKRLVLEERAKLRPDPRWTAFLDDLETLTEKPLRPGGEIPAGLHPAGFDAWRETNVRPQAQDGFVTAAVTLPLGDFTPAQARAVADLMRKYTGDTLRLTVDQNLLFRWVSGADLPALSAGLVAAGLAEAGADTITDITGCPGTDTCKLGISSSRGLAEALRTHLTVVKEKMDPAARALHIKCSGCFNSCGQHHVADLGFLGVSRNVNGRRVPHFQLVVGGQWENNGGSYGLAVGAIPSKNVPQVVDRLTARYVAERAEGEVFKDYVDRLSRKELRAMLDDLLQVPAYEDDPSFYSDWGDPREYTIGDLGVGECAGEIVAFAQMGLAASEREVFEAQIFLEEGDAQKAGERAFSAMLEAARALTREKNPDVSADPEEVVREFKAHLFDTQIFHDKYAGGKFAHYLFRIQKDGLGELTAEAAHERIEEAQLFIEAAHQCYDRMTQAQAVQTGA